MKGKIVFTSRDPGAAGQLLPIIEQVKQDGRLIPYVVAAGAALKIFSAAGQQCLPFEGEVASSDDQYDYPLPPAGAPTRALIDRARDFLNALAPVILVTGQSSMGYGVDEIFMYAARTFKPEISTFTFFDFWGGFNSLGGTQADHFLVIDEFAAKLTAPGRQGRIHVVGSPKHEASSRINVAELRRQGRSDLGLDQETLAISFFAQTSKIAGYLDNFVGLVAALSDLERQNFKFIIKAHPKAPEETGKLVEYARSRGIEPLVVTEAAENLKLLAASDIVALCTSLICLDHAYLSSAAASPIGCVIHLAMGEEIKAYMRENYGFVRNPLVQTGLGYLAETKTDLERLLADIEGNRGLIDRYFQESQKLKHGKAVEKVVNLLYRYASGESVWQKLEAFYGLPRKVVFCNRCVISNQRPSSVVEFKSKAGDPKPTIEIDEAGVCSACRFAEKKEKVIDWAQRDAELRELCAKHRSQDGRYDCIVPGSGGKDSTFTAHILKYQYGMNPLTVTWAPHKYTEVGWKNFQNWIDAGFDNILVTPNGKVHRLLTRLAFETLCHPFQPFIIGQRQIAPRFSGMYGVPLIFYGENQAEYGNNIEENDRPTMDPAFFMAAPDLDTLVLGGVPARQLLEEYGVSRNDLNPYLPIEPQRLREVGTEVHYLSYYLRWDPQECYYYAAEHTGFQANTERTEGSYSKYSSIDDRIDPLHYYTTYIKFGIGRATYDAVQEIRNQKITREEGVALVHRFDHEFPGKYFQEILEYMGISEARFWEVIDRARSPHLWKKENGTWVLRHRVQNL